MCFVCTLLHYRLNVSRYKKSDWNLYTKWTTDLMLQNLFASLQSLLRVVESALKYWNKIQMICSDDSFLLFTILHPWPLQISKTSIKVYSASRFWYWDWLRLFLLDIRIIRRLFHTVSFITSKNKIISSVYNESSAAIVTVEELEPGSG